VVDLARMPHLLVAGTTGSGKSVALNAMVLSLLYKATARDVRMLMIDPKMLELSVYQGIPHLLAPVVTDMKEAANGLRWCVAEMERRYKLMSAVGVRNLAGFNRKVRDAEEAGQPLMDPLFRPNPELGEAPRPLETLPYLVVIIDEFADMMMIVGKKVEELIARLAQKARAAGVHLILATQRPSVDVITGLIKANIPTRIAFQVSSKIDSRTILDQSGAETLLGHGDMLYLPPGTAMPERVHGAFVSATTKCIAWSNTCAASTANPNIWKACWKKCRRMAMVRSLVPPACRKRPRPVATARVRSALRRGRQDRHRIAPRLDLRRAAAAQDRLQPRRAPGRGDGSRRRGVAARTQRRPQRAGTSARDCCE
jgi:hypothetical protein